MHRSLLVLSTSVLAAGATAAAAAPADAATRTKLPVVRSVSPMSLAIGQTLTLRGSALKAGTARTTVVFQRAGGKAVFARAAKATSSSLTVVVPTALQAQLPTVKGVVTPVRFQLRVLTKRFSKGFTAPKISPMIRPAPVVVPNVPPAAPPVATPTTPAAVAPTPTCPSADPTADDDRDGLTNAEEAKLGTKPCEGDTDGDGVTDYFEQRSALDLNSTALPYPGKRPYPNALYPDADKDFDGDGLSLAEEYEAWVRTGSPRTLTYSDGTQATGGRVPAGHQPGVDLDGDGVLQDDEKDVDGDGLTNWIELHGPGQPDYWSDVLYPNEKPYPSELRPFEGFNWLDTDTDGDGLPDGADDEDHDGFSNAFEVIRPADWQTTYVSVGHPFGGNPKARTNPFNPCKPYYSSYCHRYIPIGYYGDEDWASPVFADGP